MNADLPTAVPDDPTPVVDRIQDETLAETATPPAVPPAARGESDPLPAGWYPDPADTTTQRYWDGDAWVGPSLPANIPPPPGVDASSFEPEYPEGTVVVPLVGEKIHVLPMLKWRTAAVAALKSYDYDLWARGALAGDDYARVWVPADPTVEEADAAVAEAMAARSGKSGTGPGSNSRRR